MDSRSNFTNGVIWDIEPGALVKIKKYAFSGETYYHYGIVLKEKKVNQIEMFPSVEVYTFETQCVSQQTPDTLEIISRPPNETDKSIMD